MAPNRILIHCLVQGVVGFKAGAALSSREYSAVQV